MECDRWFLVCGVLFCFYGAAIATNSTEDDVVTAFVKLNEIPSNLRKKPINDIPRSIAVLSSYSNCSGLEVLSDQFQPIYSAETSLIRKCCPLGENYQRGEHGLCGAENFNFTVSVLNATFFDTCIEDNESPPTLGIAVVNACQFRANDSKAQPLMYSKQYGDLLYVLQNGSLLVVDENFEGFEILNDYCLDIDRDDGYLYAIVCKILPNTSMRVLRTQAYLYCTCLLISVPCLLLTAFLYIKIGELRDLHGKSLACHCICLAIAYTFLSIIQVQQNISLLMTNVIQYFLLSCFCWLNVLCFDICIKISCDWICKYIGKISGNTEDKYFAAYALISFTLPIFPVVAAILQHNFGIPLYIKGQHNLENAKADYFIMPTVLLWIFCFTFLMVTFYGFGTRRPKPPTEDSSQQTLIAYEEYFKLKQTAESVAFLFAVMSICMLIELITSHLNEQTAVADGTTMSPFAFFDVLIALQGVFIFVIFICSPKPLRIVKRWWVATGSLDVAALTELEALKENSITILN